MLSPSPVPPYLREIDPSACANGSKMVVQLVSGMPTPVSATSHLEASAGGGSLAARGDADRTAVRELQGVADQVDEHLADTGSIGDGLFGHVGRDGQRQRQALALGLNLEGAHGLVEHLS